jgi:hypothetical protein
MWRLTAPLLSNLSTYGVHDWDSHLQYRQITVVSLRQYREFPFWHPWFCGGFPAWEYVEGATNVVSPFFPAYLLLPLLLAVRIEILGTLLLGVVGTYLFAGRFTKSAALRVLVVALYMFNSRWAMQTATGHTWHMQYAWLPLALYTFDRAIHGAKSMVSNALACGGVMALLVYTGGIYPLPHTALILSLVAVGSALSDGSLRPLLALAIAGLSSLGFAAPKLLPMLDLMARYPRAIDSTEAVSLGQLVAMLTSPVQGWEQGPVPVPVWGWHEYGLYVGSTGAAVLLLSLVVMPSGRALVLKVVGLLFFLLGLGAFHPRAPWVLLHELPVFASQHVPSRFLYPAVLLLAVAFVAWTARWFDPIVARKPWVDVVALLPVAVLTLDLADVGRSSLAAAFTVAMRPIEAPLGAFHHEQHPPLGHVSPTGGFVISQLYGMFTNVGSVSCHGVPEIGARGAIPKSSPEYRGEVYLVDGIGNAQLLRWSPNEAVVQIQGASPGAKLVYNMNYDPSWNADGVRALETHHAVSAALHPGDSRVRFHYFPRGLPYGLSLFALTCAGVALWWHKRR